MSHSGDLLCISFADHPYGFSFYNCVVFYLVFVLSLAREGFTVADVTGSGANAAKFTVTVWEKSLF